jgi:hypothetical protein
VSKIPQFSQHSLKLFYYKKQKLFPECYHYIEERFIAGFCPSLAGFQVVETQENNKDLDFPR